MDGHYRDRDDKDLISYGSMTKIDGSILNRFHKKFRLKTQFTSETHTKSNEQG